MLTYYCLPYLNILEIFLYIFKKKVLSMFQHRTCILIIYSSDTLRHGEQRKRTFMEYCDETILVRLTTKNNRDSLFLLKVATPEKAPRFRRHDVFASPRSTPLRIPSLVFYGVAKKKKQKAPVRHNDLLFAATRCTCRHERLEGRRQRRWRG